MDRLTAEALEALLASRDGSCISIFLPTHRVWNETPQDRVRLKNLLNEAEHQLTEAGLRKVEAQERLAPARALLGGADPFWQNQSDGLVLFIAPDTFLAYRLPLAFEEQVIVNNRFHVKPLLELFAADGLFHVLVLNQGGIRLLQGTRYGLRALDLNGVPTSLEEALQYDEFEKHQQFHSGSARRTKSGARGAMFHGQGDAADEAVLKKRIVEFFRQVDNGVRDALGETQGPLVAAGLSHLRGLYRTVNHYPDLLEAGIDVNPEELSHEELHRRAWELVEPRFRQERQKAAEAYAQLSGTEPERVSDRIESIVPAAYFKRVRALFVRSDARAWGTFDPENQQVHLHEERRPGDEDLYDLAVVHTLRNGGTAYLADADAMPGQSEAAAVFRYA